MRMNWHHSSAEFAIVETLRTAPQIDKESVLRMALSPFRYLKEISVISGKIVLLFSATRINACLCFFRKGICTFIYCGERKFVDLIRSYVRHGEHEVGLSLYCSCSSSQV